MKLTIEIDDDALRNAVSAQLGVELSKLTREVVAAEARPIVEKAVERAAQWNAHAAQEQIKRVIGERIDKLVSDALGVPSYQRTQKVTQLIGEAALRAAKDGK